MCQEQYRYLRSSWDENLLICAHDKSFLLDAHLLRFAPTAAICVHFTLDYLGDSEDFPIRFVCKLAHDNLSDVPSSIGLV